MKNFFIVVGLFLIVPVCWGQKESLPEKIDKPLFTPVAAMQFWSSYTFDEHVYHSESKTYVKQNPLTNFQIRRSRIGVKAKFNNDFTMAIIGAFDLVGRNVLAGTEGGSNNGGSPQIRLWNAYAKYRVVKNSEKLFIVAGYMIPQIGRESMTSAFQVSSFEKSWSQNYLRRHLVGTGPGRALGVNVGGILVNQDRLINYSYQIGVFTPATSSPFNEVETHQYPLTTFRFDLHIGDPEFSKYTITRKDNYYGKRKGLSLGINAAAQYQSDFFDRNSAIGIDLLLNFNHFNLSGEWIYLSRMKQNESSISQSNFHIGYSRLAYNFTLNNGSILEPSILYTFFIGATDSKSQTMAIELHSFAGIEHQVEIGLHYLVNSHLKISAGMTIRNADAGELDNVADFNNYFFQEGIGKIKRGNWIGLGLQASI